MKSNDCPDHMVNWQIMRIFESEAEANTTYTPLIPGEGEKFVPLI
jgi:hypothetical protein